MSLFLRFVLAFVLVALFAVGVSGWLGEFSAQTNVQQFFVDQGWIKGLASEFDPPNQRDQAGLPGPRAAPSPPVRPVPNGQLPPHAMARLLLNLRISQIISTSIALLVAAGIARNEADPLNQRKEGLEAAGVLGLKVLSSDATYEPGTTDFNPVLSSLVPQAPDLIVLSGVAPADAPLLIKTARELGYKGLFSTETSQDAKVLQEVAGSAADGFISVGGASNATIRSKYMEEFVAAYTKHVGEWNDEAGTKVYALEMILRVMQKNPKAMTDVAEFKKTMAGFSIKNPFLKEDKMLKFVGSAYFKQPRQIGVPMVVNEFKGGDFSTLFVGSVE